MRIQFSESTILLIPESNREKDLYRFASANIEPDAKVEQLSIQANGVSLILGPDVCGVNFL